MRDTTASAILWAEAIWYIWILPCVKMYLVYSGIVFNVILFILLVWG